ncbi:uncharacterized protein LOC114455923 isoform X2 [Gouania willdenowi]|uniref:uncharacterized protein LOC114455923 isoform X2 n=1 Tax=Gouania willdenowi TaxID=441366 RepID=UPI0010562075|nr:uncharacterized protein LOC114455923 isoform X2 [Gouania willdenowi]
MASLHPANLLVIPMNISCESFAIILTGIRESLFMLPLHQRGNVRASMMHLQQLFPRCSVQESFMCKTTPVEEDLICTGLNRSQLEQTMSAVNYSEAVCNFTVLQHACSSATQLNASNLAQLLKCSLDRPNTDAVEVWKLLFQKTAPVLHPALTAFAAMAPNNSSPALSRVLEALGEVIFDNVSQAQLQDEMFVRGLAETKLYPVLASPTLNFLSCLSTYNFSCTPYQRMVQALDRQRVNLDEETQEAVYTHFIRPFLSRNDSSDPGCVLSQINSKVWLEVNLGNFSGFATVQELLTLNSNISITDVLEDLSVAQGADVILMTNDTGLVETIFEKIKEGQPLENLDGFLKQLGGNETNSNISLAVRDEVMDSTFEIIGNLVQDFSFDDLHLWFNVKLSPILASFTQEMLINVTYNMSCNRFRVVVSGLAKVESNMMESRKEEIAEGFFNYLTRKASAIQQPGCRLEDESDAEWLEANLGPFSKNLDYAKLQMFNVSLVALSNQLTPEQNAALILDPNESTSLNEDSVKAVFGTITNSSNNQALTHFFEALVVISKQENTTFVTNSAVRDTILNETLTVLAPELEDFEPEDFRIWFQVYLIPVMASLHPANLLVIPMNISCESFAIILTGIRESLFMLPLHQRGNVRASMMHLQQLFPRCSVQESFMCKTTPVEEDLICTGLNRSQLEQTMSAVNYSEAVCNFTVLQHACSSATQLNASNLAQLLKCSLDRPNTDAVEVWKLLFQKTAPVLHPALTAFAAMAPNNSSPALSRVLEALGEVIFDNVSQAQLQDEMFVRGLAETKLYPVLASPTLNFLSCLSTYNFSCTPYQRMVQALDRQRVNLDEETQEAVYTHFIRPFLSRNDSSDPGCVLSQINSKVWLEVNLGNFSGFATVQELLTLNSNISITDVLEDLSVAQGADVILMTNDTGLVETIFEKIKEGQPLENLDGFLKQLGGNETNSNISLAVRDEVMDSTFEIIGNLVQDFSFDDLHLWFNVKLSPILASFTQEMLINVTYNMSCNRFRVVVSGLAKVESNMMESRKEEIAEGFFNYLTRKASAIQQPGCRLEDESDAEWLEANLGPFSKNLDYAKLQMFNVSLVALSNQLTPEQNAALILDPNESTSLNEDSVKAVFGTITNSSNNQALTHFFEALVVISKQENTTFVTNSAVRDTILNETLTVLAPELEDFEPEDFRIWFQVYLIPVMASLHPANLLVIPMNISCESFAIILTGIRESLFMLPLHQRGNVRASMMHLQQLFPRCSVQESFMCKTTPVEEDLICTGLNRSQLEQTMSAVNYSEAVCNFTVLQHACSSATQLNASNLAQLLKCSLDRPNTDAVEVWKLLFQKTAPVLHPALTAFAAMAPNNSSPALSRVLEALGEVIFDNVSQAQLQDEMFVRGLAETKLYPVLASPTLNFLSCLSTYNFSCTPYQRMVQALDRQRVNLDEETQEAVYTHFIRPFLSRNDSSDPGCVLSQINSKVWLEVNLGNFSGFATVQELLTLNSNISITDVLEDLSVAQGADVILMTNDTGLVETIFEKIKEGQPLENLDGFLKQLGGNETNSNISLAVRDEVMDSTFEIIGNLVQDFSFDDLHLWFNVKLSPILASFTQEMLINVTYNMSCNRFRVVVSGLAKVESNMMESRKEEIAEGFFNYLTRKASAIQQPGCRLEDESDAEWLEANLGPFSKNLDYAKLQMFNVSLVALSNQLTPEQNAALILDPNESTSLNEDSVKAVFGTITNSSNNQALTHFFEALVVISKQENTTFVTNSAVRDTILNETLTVLAPELEDFEPEDFRIWFQVYLIPVMASLHPANLLVIPMNISCESFAIILTGIRESLFMLPLHQRGNVRASMMHLQQLFPRCSVQESFMCKTTPVEEDLICTGLNRSQLEQTMSAVNYSEAVCNFTVLQHACSSATQLNASNLAQLLKCSLDRPNTDAVEVWKLLFQKTAPVLHPALTAFAAMAPNNSSPALSRVLEALGEVIFDNVSQAQLQDEMFVRGLAETKLYPVLASPTLNFLSCLSTYNFSCTPYQRMVQALDRQRVNLDEETQEAVYTHFIRPFLSRNDSSDPGCVLSQINSKVWLEVNLGNFSGFATVQELLTLNSNISITDVLEDLSVAQGADVILMTNDTGLVETIFEKIKEGQPLENLDGFLKQLGGNETNSNISLAVRDEVMDSTFEIIGNLVQDFSFDDLHLWFNVKLSPILASFTQEMLINVTYNMSCNRFRVVVSGLAKVESNMMESRKEEIAEGFFNYLTRKASAIQQPGCRIETESAAETVEANLGPFFSYIPYTEIQQTTFFNSVPLNLYSSTQKAELLLDSNNLSNATLVELVFTTLINNNPSENLPSFFDTFVSGIEEQNLTSINSTVRDTILNLTLSGLEPELSSLNAEGFKLWFQEYLLLFLPGTNANTLKIIPINITCKSFQEIVKGFSIVFPYLSMEQKRNVFMFTIDYLEGQSLSGLPCVEDANDDRRWLGDNFGPYRMEATYTDFVTLKSNFNGVEVADLLTVHQLAQLASTPLKINTTQDVTKVMSAINPSDFDDFFDVVSPIIKIQRVNYTQEVKSAFLEEVFDRANLSSPAVSNLEIQQWLRVRLEPLLSDLSSTLVSPLFSIGSNKTCNSTEEIITLLDTLQPTLSIDTQKEIQRNIQLFLQGPEPLNCYTGGSFYIYLQNTFLSFGFPGIPTFISLLPSTRKSELLSTISTSELGQFLRQPNVLANHSDICDIFSNYNNTNQFLETEDVPDDVRMQSLPCFWATALSSSSRSEADLWFDQRLKDYLIFLTKDLINSSQVQNASCFAFQKLVDFMGNNFTYNSSDFEQRDVYNSIRAYLDTGSGARCYNASDAELSSTDWFASNLGNFVSFLTVDDLTAFVSSSQMQVFVTNEANLELFSTASVSEEIRDYYLTQLFVFNPSFDLLRLPGPLLCSSAIPSSAFTAVPGDKVIEVLNRLNDFCNGTQDPEVAAALAMNIDTNNTETFTALGSSSNILTPNQLSAVSPTVINDSLETISTTNWNPEQATALIAASDLKLDSAASLQMLGTVVVGVSSEQMQNISATQLLDISKSSTFVSIMSNAPEVLQQTLVRQIISVDPDPTIVVLNVPDALATEIPASQLPFTEGTVNISVMNQKTWTSDQASIFFGTLADTDFDLEQLSPSVLHGFTCTSAQNMSTAVIQQLVHASRPRNNTAKVVLQESQLLCMYNLLSGNLSQSFTDYPADMLLFFNNSNIEKDNCVSYFSALSVADFSVASQTLQRGSILFSEALSCLEKTDFNLSRSNVEVLGNMACTLNASYIENADPLILEKLKVCSSLDDSQVAAMETLLLSGKTQYGNITTWTKETLADLGILPLYFTRNIWSRLTFTVKRRFFKVFFPSLRTNGTSPQDFKSLFVQISTIRVKRGAGCTVGNITQVTVNDGSFPFGYDSTQFDLCLDIPALKENLNSICKAVYDEGFQRIILQKLNQAYPSGVPEPQVKVLHSVSRTATVQDISKWSITQIETLAALMKSDEGSWESAKSKAIITKYLQTPGKSLGSSELNVINSNLCSLDNSTLKTITAANIRVAKPLDVTSCSAEQKRILYEISNMSFSSVRSTPSSFYTLIKNYLGGAPLADILEMSKQNVNMDIQTFQRLSPEVINGLTVDNVRALLGSHLSDIKLFENDVVVENWVNMQRQSDLETLGLGLVTNRTDQTAATPSSSNTTATPSSNNTTATPSSNNTTATPGSNNTTATPGSNSTTATPGSNNTTATPGSNNTTATPSSNSTTATPGSNSTTATPGSNSTTLTPSSNNTAATPGSNSTATTPSSNNTAATPGSNSTAVTSDSNSTAATPSSNSTTATPSSNSTTATPGSNSTTATPGSNSTAATASSNSTAATSGSNSTAATPGSNNTAATLGSNSTGTTPSSNSTATTSGSNSTAATPGFNSTAVTPGSNSTATTPSSNSTATTSGSNSTATTTSSNSTATTPSSNSTATTSGSNSTATTPSSNSTATTTSSNSTATTPSSNSTAATSDSNSTAATPGSNSTATTPSSNNTAATPGSNSTTVTSDSNSTAATPSSNSISAMPSSNSTATTPSSNNTATTPGSNSTATTPSSNNTAATPSSNSTAATPSSNSTATTSGSNSTATTPSSNSTATTSGSNSTATTPSSNSTATTSGSNSTAATPSSNSTATTTSSNSTATTPSSNSTATTPSSNSTDATSGSSSTAATPGSNSSAATPGSNSTATTPSSNSTADTSGSNSTAVTPGSNSTTATSGSNSTTATLGSNTSDATSSSNSTAATIAGGVECVILGVLVMTLILQL